MADIVILNGRLVTFDGPDAEALAITKGKISAVGTNADMTPHLSGARILDAGGGTVLPGFIDSHVHLFQAAVEAGWVQLHGARTKKDVAQAVHDWAEAHPAANIVFGIGLSWSAMDGEAANRHHLDEILQDRPLAAMSADHHVVWANTRALRVAGLLYGSNTAEGSAVVIGPDGIATGQLFEVGAFAPLLKLTASGGREVAGYEFGKDPVPPPTRAQRETDKSLIEAALKLGASKGITGLHNMDGNVYQLELLSELEAEGRLTARVEIPLHFKNFDSPDRLQEASDMRSRFSGEMVWCNRIKMFMDGVIDSRTACMLKPFKDTGHIAQPLFTAKQFSDICVRADAMNFQISVHAIGDAAVRNVLDGYEAAQRTNGVRDSRHRVEHIEFLHPDDLERFSHLGVAASMQPLHGPGGGFFDYGSSDDSIFDAKELSWSFPFRSLTEAGIPLVLNTDWPVVPVDVMRSVQAIVAGRDLPAPWRDQRLTLRQALAGYTRDPAWLEFNEHKKGRLRAGMMADVVVMSHDLDACDISDLSKAYAVYTIFDGRVVFEASR